MSNETEITEKTIEITTTNDNNNSDNNSTINLNCDDKSNSTTKSLIIAESPINNIVSNVQNSFENLSNLLLPPVNDELIENKQEKNTSKKEEDAILDDMTYKELQKIAIGYELPGNMKTDALRSVIRAFRRGDTAEVQRIILNRRVKRGRNASAPQEAARSHRLNIYRATRRARTDSSGSSDPQWIPPPHYRGRNNAYFGVVGSPSSIVSGSDVYSEQSSRGPTPTLVRGSPANRSYGSTPPVANTPSTGGTPTSLPRSVRTSTPISYPGEANWQRGDHNPLNSGNVAPSHDPLQLGNPVASTSRPPGTPRRFVKKASRWRDEYLKQTGLEQTKKCLQDKTPGLHTMQGNVTDPLRYQPYQRPRNGPPVYPYELPHDSNIPHPPPLPTPPQPYPPNVPTPDYPPFNQYQPPNYSSYPFIPHNPPYPQNNYVNPVNRQAFLRYLMSKNCLPRPPPLLPYTPQQWYQQNQPQTEGRFPLLTQLLDKARAEPARTKSTPTCTVTSDVSNGSVANLPSPSNEVEIVADFGNPAVLKTEERKLVDMRKVPSRGDIVFHGTDRMRVIETANQEPPVYQSWNTNSNYNYAMTNYNNQNLNYMQGNYNQPYDNIQQNSAVLPNTTTVLPNLPNSTVLPNPNVPMSAGMPNTTVLQDISNATGMPSSTVLQDISNATVLSSSTVLQDISNATVLSSSTVLQDVPNSTGMSNQPSNPSQSMTLPNSTVLSSSTSTVLPNHPMLPNTSTVLPNHPVMPNQAENPWLTSNYNWIHSQPPPPPPYEEVSSTPVEETNELPHNNPDIDFTIPDDIDRHFDDALSASWPEMPHLDENFLRCILSPSKNAMCQNQLNGCYETFLTEHQRSSHERRCLLRNVQCLMNPCKWVGLLTMLSQHLIQMHSQKVTKGHEQSHVVTTTDLRAMSTVRFLQYVHDRLFVIEVHYRGQVVHAACQWIPDPQVEQQADLVPLCSLEIVGINGGKPSSWRGFLEQYPTPFQVPRGYTGRNPCLSVALPWAYHAKITYFLLHVNISMIPEHLKPKDGATAPANSPATPSPKQPDDSTATQERT